METVREPTLCKCKRGATAVHCYGCVTIDCCRNKSSAGQACKLLKPSKYVCTSALRQTAHLWDRYCLQGRQWGYPGNCQFSSYAQCMATASGTDAYCGINPQYAFARQQRGPYRDRY
jgi:hypothetical protein